MSVVRNLVQGSLERMNVRLATHDPINIGSEPPMLPILIRGIFGAAHPVTFCQVGANDCSSNDPLQRLIQPHWRGLMIEPQPQAYARIQEKFAGNTMLQLRNCAVSEKRGDVTLYTVRNSGGASDAMDGVASFSRQHVLKFIGDASRIDAISVPAIPLMDLLAEAGFQNLDVLSVDVEGFDDHVVKMLDLKRIRPAIIQYEHKHIPLLRERNCVEWLSGHGYRLMRLPLDTIAIDENVIKSDL